MISGLVDATPMITPPGPVLAPDDGLSASAGTTPGGAAFETMTTTLASVGELIVGMPTILMFLPKLIVVSDEKFFPCKSSVYELPGRNMAGETASTRGPLSISVGFGCGSGAGGSTGDATGGCCSGIGIGTDSGIGVGTGAGAG